MEKSPVSNTEVRKPINASDISRGTNYFLTELIAEDTGRYTRNEYIRELHELLDAAQQSFSVKININERDDLVVAEAIGLPLSELRFVGINDEDKRYRGVMQFRDDMWRAYRLPLNLLSTGFRIEVEEL